MIYVMSDIHGNRRRFESVMKQIDLQPEDTLYVLGDVIDRYPDGIRILRKLMNMPNVKMLIGNHELMMLDVLCSDANENSLAAWFPLSRWYNNGGGVTHNYLKHIRKSIRIEIVEFLKTLPLSYDIEVNDQQYKLVHAAPPELYLQYHHQFSDARMFAVWKRWKENEFHETDYIMIFGHTPTIEYSDSYPLRIWYGDHMIAIDCGSGFPSHLDLGGRLACLRLDDMKEFYSEKEEDDFYESAGN